MSSQVTIQPNSESLSQDPQRTPRQQEAWVPIVSHQKVSKEFGRDPALFPLLCGLRALCVRFRLHRYGFRRQWSADIPSFRFLLSAFYFLPSPISDLCSLRCLLFNCMNTPYCLPYESNIQRLEPFRHAAGLSTPRALIRYEETIAH